MTCILFLSGHSFLYPNTNQNCINYSSTTPKTAACADFSSVQNNQNSIISISSSRETENDDFNDLFIDDDNDDDDSFKKHVVNSNYSTSILCTQTLESIYSFSKETFSLYNYLSYTSSYKYIVFQTFRI